MHRISIRVRSSGFNRFYHIGLCELKALAPTPESWHSCRRLINPQYIKRDGIRGPSIKCSRERVITTLGSTRNLKTLKHLRVSAFGLNVLGSWK